MTMVTGSAMLSVSIGLNAVSSHGTCTAVFVAIVTVVVFILASIPTLGKISVLGWIGLASILSAVLTLAIAVAVEDKPHDAPAGDWPGSKQLNIVNSPSFYDAISAVSSLVLSYGGTPAYLSMASEMRDPRHYTRAILVCNFFITAVYIVSIFLHPTVSQQS